MTTDELHIATSQDYYLHTGGLELHFPFIHSAAGTPTRVCPGSHLKNTNF